MTIGLDGLEVTGPFLVSENTVDIESTGGNCIYAAAPIGGVPLPTTVFFNKGAEVIKVIPPGHICAPVVPTKINQFNPIPCVPARSMPSAINCVNKTVRINGVYPCVASTPPLGGDTTIIVAEPGTPRTLTGPFQCPTIIIGSRK
tara:strand:- start:106 stop:540 length:435 start_codon:yes stop_codon:yes gene_type:complete